MITTIFFDLDGVVFDFLKTENYSLHHTFEKYHIDLTDERLKIYHRINTKLWQDFEKGLVDKDRVTLGRFNDLFKELNITGIDYVKFAIDYQNGLADGFFLYEDAYPVLERLSKKYRLYATTNGVSTTAYNRLKGTDTRKFFTDVFVSEDLHAQKPSLEYFNQVTAAIDNYDPSTTILVGDSLTSDIQGANNLGIPSIFVNRKNNPVTGNIQPTYIITSLNELEALLERV